MRFETLVGTAALFGACCALSDSTPWVLLSTTTIEGPNAKQIQSSEDTIRATKKFLSRCPTDDYLIATQPGLNAGDLKHQNGAAMPTFHQAAAKDNRVKSKYIVSEVVGTIVTEDLVSFIEEACAKQNKKANVQQVDLDPLTGADRAESLSKNDDRLNTYMQKTTSSGSFSILLFSPPGEPTYTAHFDDSLHMDLRREAEDKGPGDDDKKERDTRSLFEKYQFFTPAIFMGLLAVILLFSILTVGIRALSSLEVSYGAFEKEMGPGAQKKHQ